MQWIRSVVRVGLMKGLYERTSRSRKTYGLTLIELMLATTVMAIMTLGTLQYQYFAAGHGQVARAQIEAVRLSQLLLEDWKSTGGSDQYDPSLLELGYTKHPGMPDNFDTPEGLGATLQEAVFSIDLNHLPMALVLKYEDVDKDLQAGTCLRQLAVVVRFGSVERGQISVSEDRLAGLPPITLVTFARVDASSG